MDHWRWDCILLLQSPVAHPSNVWKVVQSPNSKCHHFRRGKIHTVIVLAGELTCVFKYNTGFWEEILGNLWTPFQQEAGGPFRQTDLLVQYLNNLATSLAFHLPGSSKIWIQTPPSCQADIRHQFTQRCSFHKSWRLLLYQGFSKSQNQKEKF